MLRLLAIICIFLVLPLAGRGAEVPLAVRADEQILRSASLSTEGPALLDFLRKQTECAAQPERIQTLITKLGDDEFAVRERASEDLVALGRVALPALRKAIQEQRGKDFEIVHRADWCVQRIDQGSNALFPAAVIRMIALKRPAGAAEVLLAYAPYAEGQLIVQEIGNALNVLASTGPIDPALKAALRDPLPVRRALAAEALGKINEPEVQDTVRAMLKDADPVVRLRVGLGMARKHDKSAVPVLIDLLASAPPDLCWPVEDFLYQIAGDDAPMWPSNSGEAQRKEFRDAWAAWWKKHADEIDLAKAIEARKLLGYSLIVLLDEGKILELDANNQPRWSLEKLALPLDVQLLSGDRVLIAEQADGVVTERNLRGETLWKKEIVSPLVAQRLPNGNTFIATKTVLTEIDREGKELYRHAQSPNTMIMRATKLPNGDIVYVNDNRRLFRLSADGRVQSSFQVNVGTYGGRIDALRNGHFLVPERDLNRVAEYDASGNVVWEIKVSQPVAAVRLPNGNTLATSMDQSRAIEFDRYGKEVWEYRHPTRVSRAFRR